MIKAVIFDLDGTLLNTIDDLTDSTNFALSNFNYPRKSIMEIKNFVGNGVEKLIERAIPMGKENKNFNACLKLFTIHYSQNNCNKTCPYNGILDLLTQLNQNNIKIGILSNKYDNAVKNLCKKYFSKTFDIAQGETDKIKRKPCADGVLNIISEFNLKKNEVIFVGDSEVDIQTAKNAGIDCLSVLWGFKDKDFLIKNNAIHLISKPSEILDYINKENK